MEEIKKKSARRKRHLRDMNQKIQRYIAVADAAISAESALWKERYYELLEKQIEKDKISGKIDS